MEKDDSKQPPSVNSQKNLDLKAHQKGDLRYFLKPWLTFRATLNYYNGDKFFLYAHEHQCTYKQLYAGKIAHIAMSRVKGYNDLVRYIEQRLKLLKTAQIYMRVGFTGPFDILCRNYYLSKRLEDTKDCKDPEIAHDQDLRTLYYYFKNGLLVITETDPNSEDFTLNL